MEDGERCPNRHNAKGMCTPHQRRAERYGNPTIREKRPRGQLLQELKAAAHARTDDCVFLNGYAERPVVLMEGKTWHAARYVWKLRHGDPGQAYVLHSCNGGSGDHGCINIRHLYLGDHRRNMRDMVEAGNTMRGEIQNRGEEHGMAKLREEDVREIRRLSAAGMGRQAVADLFNVSRSAVVAIVHRRRWGWLPDA
ncbi:helix-turn-helix domain-containing protein [Streptomyces griseoincarnatus]